MSLIKKPHELDTNKNIKMLLYGQPGIGKSTLALSAPSPLHLDFDGGVHRVKAEHLAPTVQVKNYQEILDLFQNEDLTPFKTIIIDTAGKMLDYMSSYLVAADPKMGRKDGQLSLQGYGARKGMFLRFLSQAATMGKNLVFVAHEKEEKEGDLKVIRPEIGGSSGNDLIKDLDLVGYVEAIGKTRAISFDPCEKFYGKNTCGLSSTISLKNLDKDRNDMLSGIFSTFESNLQKRNSLKKTYDGFMDTVRNKISFVVDADSANDFVVWAQNAEHIWDSSIQSRLFLVAKAKELKLTFSAKEKMYLQSQEVANVG